MYMNDLRVEEGLRRLHIQKGRWQIDVEYPNCINRCAAVVAGVL